MRRSTLVLACGLLALLIAAPFIAGDASRAGWWSWLTGQPRHTFAHTQCGIPVHYALGAIDGRFGFDEFTVMAAMVEAASLWQSTTDALLFIESDHPSAMRVSLEFDARQHAANTRRSLRGGLDRDRRELAGEEALLLQWHERIEAARHAHDRTSAALARRVQAHEADGAAWTAGPGPRSDPRRRALAEESAALRAELAELERQGQALNTDIAAYNRRAGDVRRLAEDFRLRVAQYNQASSGAPVESGRYSYDRAEGRRIEVFRAESYDELVWVLAHELGHALGLGHVADPLAIMHATLHDGGELQPGRARPARLSDADQDALLEVCGGRISRERAASGTVGRTPWSGARDGPPA